MFRKIFAAAAAGLLLLTALSGCGNKTPNPAGGGSSIISESDAKTAAFSHAGVSESDVSGLRIRLEYDDGRQQYEVDFYANGKEYDYDIDAQSGSILSYDSEIENDFNPQHYGAGNTSSNTSSNTQSLSQDGASSANGANNSSSQASVQGVISESEAKSIALARVPGATDSDIRIHVDFDDGRTIYEGSIVYAAREYDFEINAADGRIIEWEEESVFD